MTQRRRDPPRGGGHPGPVGLAHLGPPLTPDELAAANARRLSPAAAAALDAAGPALLEADELPVFRTREEAAAWLETHIPSAAADARWRAVPGNVEAAQARLDAVRTRAAGPAKQPVATSLRLEADTVRRLRVLAAKKGTKYQTLLKTFVVERLYEEERREGLVGSPAS